MNRRRLVGIWMVVILVLSVSPGAPEASPILPYAAHFVEYAILGLLLMRAIVYTGDRAHGNSAVIAVAAAFSYGAVMEIVQLSLPYRSFSVADMAANLLGAATGLLAFRLLARRESGPRQT